MDMSKVDYGWGLLLVSTLAAQINGSMSEVSIKTGMEELILKIIDYAKLVVNENVSFFGAGDQNRTGLFSLEGRYTTDVLHPHFY